MDNPGKEVELQSDWEAAGVGIEIPKVNPAAAKALKRKRQNSALKPSASGPKAPSRPSRQEVVDGKKISGSTPPAALNTNVSSPAPNNAATSSTPPAENPTPPAPNANAHAEAGSGDDEERLREEMDARLREQGFLPFVADLEAMKRVYTVGLNLFRRMSGDVPAEMARILRGKITACNSENRRLAGELEKIQAELKSPPDKRYLNLSSENRELREKAEKAQGMKKELDDARTTIANQATQLQALPGMRAETERAKEAEKKARGEAEALKLQVDELAAGKAEALKKAAVANARGYQEAVNLAFTLAPWLHEHSAFFDGKHYAKDEKVWLGNQVVYEPPLEAEAEDEEEGEPAGDGGQ